MLGLDPKAARYTWTAVVVLLLLAFIYQVRSTLFIFILALMFAYMLSPLVNLLDRVLPGRGTRTAALALSYVIIVTLAVFAGIKVGSIAIAQAKDLNSRLPGMIQSLKTPNPNGSETVNAIKEQLVDKVGGWVAEHSSDMVSEVASAGVKFVTVASGLIYVVLIPILAFFFLKDASAMRQHIIDLMPDSSRRLLLDELMADIHLLLAHYMRALFGLALAAFIAYSIFFSIIGLPYVVLLAAIGGMLEFIPIIGPLTAAAIITIVALVANVSIVAVLIFLGAYRVFQDYMLSPHLMGQGVELHPLVILFGVFAGAEVAGIPGTFLSVPILALLRVLYLRVRKARLSVPVA